MTDLLPFTAAELSGLKKTLSDCEINPYIRVTLDRLIATIERRDEQIEKLREALTFAKPIVGAAVAKSDNEARPQRQKVYTKISEALAATEPPNG